MQMAISFTAHKMARQWFGGLVPLSWQDTWLNEGFSKYFQYETIAEIGQNNATVRQIL